MKTTTFGLDLAKRVFQIHWVDMETGEIGKRQLKRDQVRPFFANRAPAVVAMEACGSAHYWARQLTGLGHDVRLIAAHFVRPFVKRNKTDAADAQAIWEAVQRPEMRFVAIKSEAQQGVLTLHRVREQLMKMRRMQVNQMHGLLYEFGAGVPAGPHGMTHAARALTELADTLPAMVIETLREQLQRIEALTHDIAAIERRLAAWQREDEAAKRLMAIPGVGLLSASAAIATIGDASTFRSGREFAAFLGLVPRQSGTGGRVKLLGISKRGDVYLRTLLIHGARSVLTHQKQFSEHLQHLLARRPFNVAVVALANKIARTIWALLAHGRTYEHGYVAHAA
ncbi:IS110 family transposase [Trinickia soli]|uniref:IS110 family transposase n=1 Tax=Trinickia soli TaxID=380675 RepID=A0A2N7WGQ5_9BURK|nr:IS110 family transposase [Trinickia soli]KAA0069528.1 IS110 family transposase [Paraburkholderia sp. T12-10]PMS28541.1 IS110 family transposase [Trinickia soli]CAB3672469.1 IS110 family transposase ISAfe1 [Trinickia soli]